MNPVVESALISAAATVVGVGGTVTVAIMGFRNSRQANEATIKATEDTAAVARETNQATIDAAHADVRRALEATREGQVADRYSRAIEQIGSAMVDVQIGGVYALERVARDSPPDHPTVMEVLAAFIRGHSHLQWPVHGPDDGPAPERTMRPEVQAALTVIGRRDPSHDQQPIDLSRSDLSGADLSGAKLADGCLNGAVLAQAKLADAVLTRAGLSGADLIGADLTHADLTHADLTHADLTHAVLPQARLESAGLAGAKLIGAHLNDADLTRASLARADLTGAHLRGTKLIETNLTEANLTEAVLTGAVLARTVFYLADLSRVDLTNAQLSGDMPTPNGWIRDPGSGRLRRASTDADDSGN
jgi:uncharacterized protein YjbI with pentapeptide repeats